MERPVPSSPSLILPIVLGACAFAAYVADGFLIGQGGLILLIAIPVVLACVIGAIVAAASGRGKVALVRVASGVLWIVAVVATVVTVSLHAKGAKRRAETVVAACKEFRAAEGHYPATLDDLVPRYLSAVPRARYTLLFGSFDYTSSPEKTSLMFVVLPPFMRTTYDFDEERWFTLD